MTAKLSISIVIPVFNEEQQIKGCLDFISVQSVSPTEVIIVDNNCTDKTIEIALAYPFVRVIVESRQGRGFARTAGFNSVKSDIIGRIDADSRINFDWVETAVQCFEKDEQLMGLTGIGKTSFIPGIQNIKTTLFAHCYYWYVRAGFKTTTMWGATMAIRRSAWVDVSDKVCNDDTKVHEDQDVSLWVAGDGGKIIQNNNLKITANGQAYMSFRKALHYRALYISTKKIHRENGNLTRAKRSNHNVATHIAGAFGVYVLGGLILILSTMLFVLKLPIKIFETKGQ